MKIFIAAFILMVMSSCYHKTFSLQLVNTTNYNIDSIKLGCSDIDTTLSIEAYDSVTLSIEPRMFFPVDEPVLCYRVKNYSTSQNSFVNTTGYAIPFKQFTTQRTNKIQIEVNSEAPDSIDVFKLTPK